MNDDDKLNSNSQGFRSNKKTGCKNLLVNHCPGQKKKINRLSCLRASLLLAVSLSPAMVFASPVQDYLTDGYFWYTQGRSQAAREKWQKALQISPGNQEAQSALQELDRFNPATLNQDQLNQARQFARQNRYQDAITAYDKAFNGPPPTSYYAAEYYETLSGTESGWSDAIAGLRKLASTWPSNPEFQVTLARVLSYREETRREAIDKLAKLAGDEQLDENLREKAVANWRQALLWLNADVDDKPLYVSYLNSHPDATVEGTMNNMSKPAGELGKAYELLEANQLDRARTIFSKIRSEDPENAEAVAGLGIIELRHRRFSNAASLLEKAIQKNGRINPEIVGKPATFIAEYAGFNVPPDTTVLIAECTKVGKDEPFSMEKLSPTLAFYVVDGWLEGCHRCIDLLNFGGIGHTMVIHSNDKEIIMKFAMEKPAFRIIVNSPASLGAVGYTTDLAPSLTLGVGTWGGSIISENVTAKHLIKVKTLAFETHPINKGESVNSFDGVAIGATDFAHTGSFTELIEERLRARAGNPAVPPNITTAGSKTTTEKTTLGKNITPSEVEKIIREFKL